MSDRFEYRVCTAQEQRVTWVNGAWQGKKPPTQDARAALESCPHVWDYLGEAGREGWELVATMASPAAPGAASFQALYLKRVIR